MEWFSRWMILVYGVVCLLILALLCWGYSRKCRQSPVQMITSPSDVSLASMVNPPLGEPSIDPHRLHLALHHPHQEVEMISLTPHLSPFEHREVLEHQRKQRRTNLDDLMV